VGTEHQRRSPASLGAIVEDVRRRWLAHRGEGSWSILGVSMGGMAAMAWCERWPNELARVVLVNTSAANLGRPFERFSFAALPRVARALASSDAEVRERVVLELCSRVPHLREQHLARFLEPARRMPVRRHTFVAQLVAAARYRAPRSLAVPALILASTRDELVSVECSRRLAARLGAGCLEHPWAGHDLLLDDPAWALARIEEWVRG
jgi:pimeloyl-ACP methyl ester carboxylesterase